MRSEYNSLTTRPSSIMGSELGSHITILKPTDHVPSDILSTFGNFLIQHEETWIHRAKLIFRILSFCLGPGNIWRFPEQSFTYGNATYIYLYIFYSSIFSVPLLVFELSLSQYFIKGFAKIFTLCPIMEGITLSMSFYCIMANLVYSSISVYAITYWFSSMHEVMPHDLCSKFNKDNYGCEENSTNYTKSPEYLFFFNQVERAVNMGGEQYNWRNACVLALVWLLLCLIILFGSLRYDLLMVILSVVIFLTLLYAAIISAVSLKGAKDGLKQMFIPTRNDINQFKVWIYSAEQSVVSLGVGAGPLTTIWSTSKVKRWSCIDCIIVNSAAFICSMLAGLVYFSAAGVVAKEHNITINNLLQDYNNEDLNTFILVTHSFNNLKDGLDNFTSILYYLMLFGSCCYSLLEYTQIILLYISSYVTPKKSLRGRIIIAVCFILYVVTTNIVVCKVGYPILRAVNKIYIPTALLIILCFELLSVTFLYGLNNFCDDIDFLLEFAPSLYYQVAWVLLPGVFGVFSIASLYIKFRDMRNKYDLLVLCLTISFTLVPILAFALYQCYVGIKNKNLKSILNPRLTSSDWERGSFPPDMELPTFAGTELPTRSGVKSRLG